VSSRDISPPVFFSYKLNPEVVRAVEEAIKDVEAGRVLRLKRMPKVKELLAIARRKGLIPETNHSGKPTD
jgi:hypothetical protein